MVIEALKWCVRALDADHPAAIAAREALAQHDQRGGVLTVVGFRSDGDGGPILTATEDVRLHEGDKLYTAPPAPTVPNGRGMAAFRRKWEQCETQCECKCCGTLFFGAVPERAAPTVPDEVALFRWLQENEADLGAWREPCGDDEYAIWWQVVKGRKSISGHPLGSPQDAIRAAMLAAAPESTNVQP